MRVQVLRLGHRVKRDKRVSTHVCLVARAFGAEKIVFEGEIEKKIKEKVKDVCERFGGGFSIEETSSAQKYMREMRENGFAVVHLTMYGIPLTKVLGELRGMNRVLIIVGAEKVPRWVYEEADYNISVTNQPHSEIAALAVFLDRLLRGKEFKMTFKGAKLRIIPTRKGKKVLKI